MSKSVEEILSSNYDQNDYPVLEAYYLGLGPDKEGMVNQIQEIALSSDDTYLLKLVGVDLPNPNNEVNEHNHE